MTPEPTALGDILRLLRPSAQRPSDVPGQTFIPGVAPALPHNGPAGAAGARMVAELFKGYAPMISAKLSELTPEQLARLAHDLFEASAIAPAQLTRLGAALRSESLARALAASPANEEAFERGAYALDMRSGSWTFRT